MKVIILTGFLGAGKTTFLQSLAKHIDEFVILENDYANADVDKRLLADTDSDIYSLDQGCICCSKKNDFATSVLTISNSIDPKYLLIEPTGLGYVSRIIENIKAIKYDRIEIMSPIAIVDIHTMEQTINEFPDLFEDQIKNSRHIILSKTEDLNRETIANAANKLRKMTSAVVYEKHYKDFDSDEWKTLITSLDLNDIELSEKSGLEMEELVYNYVELPDREQLLTILSVICQGRFGRVLRGKGTIKIGNQAIKIDIVQDTFEIKDHNEALDKFVLIGRDLDKEAMDILFKKDR